MIEPIRYEGGIYAIDADYPPQVDAIHFVDDGGEVAIVDCGVNRSVPHVLHALQAIGRQPEDVRYLVLTHVHLDHAGGAGLLMSKLPHATAIVHPRGAQHMVAPARLVAGASAVYGAQRFHDLYGDILPIAQARVQSTPLGTRLPLGGRELVTFDAPGHCLHHHVIQDSATGGVFTGDAFGLSYPDFNRDGMQFIFPSTSPVQFDPVAYHGTIDRVVALQPEAVYVTHFSQVRDVPRLAEDLHRLVDEHAALALAMEDEYRGAPDAEGYEARLHASMQQLALREARRQRWPVSDDVVLKVLAIDIELNAQGLLAWLAFRQKQ